MLLQFVGPHSCITDAARPTSVVSARMSIGGASPYTVDEDVDVSSDSAPILSTTLNVAGLPSTSPHASPMSAAAATSEQ